MTVKIQKAVTVQMDREALTYFQTLYDQILNKGSGIQFEALVFLAAALKQVGVSHETVKKLCVEGQFVSWTDLLKSRYSFMEYRGMGIPLQQARLLAEKIHPNTAIRTLPCDKADRNLCYSVAAI